MNLKMKNLTRMVIIAVQVMAMMLVFVNPGVSGKSPAISENSQICLDCHVFSTPGIVAGWRKGHMAEETPKEAMTHAPLSRKVSYKKIPEELERVVVGCAECHTLNPDQHKDTFDHNGYSVHVVVTPRDCAVCHPKETDQFSENLMSHAYGNLQGNPVFRSLADATNGLQMYEKGRIAHKAPDPHMDADSCLYCHGTKVTVKGLTTRDTPDGEMDFPVLTGWPNRGVGRINPDGSRGSCSACHTRHSFSMEMARKPYTCSECHKGPDVPAYKVYNVSKHGNIFSALGKDWNFEAVPWTVGKDFTAPTCAVCHVSLVVSPEGDVISERTHRMSGRLPTRLFGLVYAHPSPKSPDTSIIKNAAGLPLPTDLTGEPAMMYLIDQKEQDRRQKTMDRICLSCHAKGWVDGHFDRLKKNIEFTNRMTRTATDIMITSWKEGFAKGLDQKDNLFNEAIEKMWVEQWLFYANTTRLASAMAGADYGVFANGRWYLSKNIQSMMDWLKLHQEISRNRKSP